MNQNYDKEFIIRYQNRLCSKQEEADFETWLSESADADKIQPWMEQIWVVSSKDKGAILGVEDRILAKILAKIPQNSRDFYLSRQKLNKIDTAKRRSFFPLVLRYASIILVLIVPILVVYSMYSPQEEVNPVTLLEKQTHNGQHLHFALDDGTRIVLNSNSKLIYPEQFSDTSRTVTLIGEAFFNVAKDSQRPFKVVSGSVSTTALGTTFNIHYHPENPLTSVSLVSGSVLVNVATQGLVEEIYLQPGEMVKYDFQNDSYVKNEFDRLEVIGWKDGVILFKEANLDEVINRLEEWYDVKIAVSGNLNQTGKSSWTYTGKFKKQTLENVLMGIGYVKNFDFEIEEKNVKIIFK